LLSGLPWASGWGTYFTWFRNLTIATATAPDWPISKDEPRAVSRSEGLDRQPGLTGPADTQSTMPGMTAAEMAAMPSEVASNQEVRPGPSSWKLSDLNIVVPAVQAQHLLRPVWILPPSQTAAHWIGTSQAQDRTRRREVKVDATSGQIVDSSSFEDLPRLDKIVNIGVSMHEGHLFGRANQVILLTTAVALVGMSVSAIAMWWRRRPSGRLGAPRARAGREVVIGLLVTVCLLALLFPMFGASLIVVLLLERFVLVRIPHVAEWLGLRTRSAE
jgi:uncharacterized iron-regulated membrane protein